jgi:hypothetical protein
VSRTGTGSVETGTYPLGGAWNRAGVIGYEVKMLMALVQIPSTHLARSEWALQNSIAEAIVLHTRNLCDFCIPTHPDNITPADLLDNYNRDQKYRKLRDLIELLKDRYSTDSDPSNPGSVRQVFNKRLAHPDKDRTATPVCLNSSRSRSTDQLQKLQFSRRDVM